MKRVNNFRDTIGESLQPAAKVAETEAVAGRLAAPASTNRSTIVSCVSAVCSSRARQLQTNKSQRFDGSVGYSL